LRMLRRSRSSSGNYTPDRSLPPTVAIDGMQARYRG
jgi:hypothetical protein